MDNQDKPAQGERWEFGQPMPDSLAVQRRAPSQPPAKKSTFNFTSLSSGIQQSLKDVYSGLVSGLALQRIREALSEDENLREVFYHGGKNALIYLGLAYAHEFAHQMIQTYYAGEDEDVELPFYASSIIMATLLPLYVHAVVDSYLNATTEQIILMQSDDKKNARQIRQIKQPRCDHPMEYSVNALFLRPLTNIVFYATLASTRRNLDLFWLAPFFEAVYYGKTLTYPRLCNDCKSDAQKKHALSVIGYGASPWVLTQFLNAAIGKITGVQTFYTEHAISILVYYVALLHSFSANMEFKESHLQFEAFGLSNMIAEGVIDQTKKRLKEGTGPALVDAKMLRDWMAFHDAYFRHISGVGISSLERFTENPSGYYMVRTLFPTVSIAAEHLSKLHKNPKIKMGMWAKYVAETLNVPLKGADTLSAIDYLLREGWLSRAYLQSVVRTMENSLENDRGASKHASQRDFQAGKTAWLLTDAPRHREDDELPLDAPAPIKAEEGEPREILTTTPVPAEHAKVTNAIPVLSKKRKGKKAKEVQSSMASTVADDDVASQGGESVQSTPAAHTAVTTTVLHHRRRKGGAQTASQTGSRTYKPTVTPHPTEGGIAIFTDYSGPSKP